MKFKQRMAQAKRELSQYIDGSDMDVANAYDMEDMDEFIRMLAHDVEGRDGTEGHIIRREVKKELRLFAQKKLKKCENPAEAKIGGEVTCSK